MKGQHDGFFHHTSCVEQSCCQHFWDLCHSIKSCCVLQCVGLQPACSLGEMWVDFLTSNQGSSVWRSSWSAHAGDFCSWGSLGEAQVKLPSRPRMLMMIGLGSLFVCFIVMLLVCCVHVVVWSFLYVTVPLLTKYMTIIVRQLSYKSEWLFILPSLDGCDWRGLEILTTTHVNVLTYASTYERTYACTRKQTRTHTPTQARIETQNGSIFRWPITACHARYRRSRHIITFSFFLGISGHIFHLFPIKNMKKSNLLQLLALGLEPAVCFIHDGISLLHLSHVSL